MQITKLSFRFQVCGGWTSG